MSRLPSLTGMQLLTALERLDFAVIRIRGSHHYLRHPDGRATVVPVHRGETIGRGLLSKILRDAEVSREQLQEYL